MSDGVRSRDIVDAMVDGDLHRERLARLLDPPPEIMEQARQAVWHRHLLASEVRRYLDAGILDTVLPIVAPFVANSSLEERQAMARSMVDAVLQPACDLAMLVAQRQMMAESIAADGGPVMRMGDALEAARAGKKIARTGWNGAGMWVAYMPETTIAADQVNERTRAHVPDGDLHVGAYFAMMTAQGVWQPGWLASQADMDADDWTIVS